MKPTVVITLLGARGNHQPLGRKVPGRFQQHTGNLAERGSSASD